MENNTFFVDLQSEFKELLAITDDQVINYLASLPKINPAKGEHDTNIMLSKFQVGLYVLEQQYIEKANTVLGKISLNDDPKNKILVDEFNELKSTYCYYSKMLSLSLRNQIGSIGIGQSIQIREGGKIVIVSLIKHIVFIIAESSPSLKGLFGKG